MTEKTVSQHIRARIRGLENVDNKKDLAIDETIEDVITEEGKDPNLKINTKAYVNRLLKVKGKDVIPPSKLEGD